VHPVENAQEGRLAAARGADQRGDPAGCHLQRHLVEDHVVTEPGRDFAGLERGKLLRHVH
jgi:hypothetical protein